MRMFKLASESSQVLATATHVAVLVMIAGFALIPFMIPLGIGQLHGQDWGLVAFGLVLLAEVGFLLGTAALVPGGIGHFPKHMVLWFAEPLDVSTFGWPRSSMLVCGLLLSGAALVPIWPLLDGGAVRGNLGIEGRWLFAVILGCLGGPLTFLGVIYLFALGFFITSRNRMSRTRRMMRKDESRCSAGQRRHQ